MENKVSKTILEELKRYNQINSYIVEQDAALPPPPTGDEPGAVEPPPPAADDTTLGGATPPEGEAAPETGAPMILKTTLMLKKLKRVILKVEKMIVVLKSWILQNWSPHRKTCSQSRKNT